ncbi:hypothetical protein P8C59_003131 [Phyllachora maydis]|uniref:Retrovirus-related Pol polyprotein from transposon TNT 1-94-like beta-barrel domain-containing protein n=1 Tax=Phyllachora maydis TaxID=1825666 RepID=A0AAD9I180_9PEZI|nr:hypothetical protein P8C59_003131 [Phyllachora maydis]
MADQAKGKGIAPKRASNPADSGQSSRPPLPIRTLLEDREDGKDYSKVIEVLKHVSAIKNISSTLASLTYSSNTAAATTGKTSYSPRFDPFSGTMDLDSPLHLPRKEPHLGPAVDNTATSNLDPLIDTGSKKGFKDTITSSIVKERSKKAYTIPDNKNPDISNTYSNSDQAVLLMLLRDSLSSGPRAAISWIHIPSKAFKLLVRQYSRPIESKKKDNLSFLAGNPATEAYRAAYVANSSNSTPNSNSNPSKKGKNKKKGKKKASYNIKGQNYSAKSAEQASFMLGSYKLAIKEEEESDSSSNSNHISNSEERFTTFTPNTGQLRPINTRNSPVSPAGIGSITLEVLSRKAPPTYTKLVLDNVLYLPNININIIMEIPSNSIRKEDYRPIIEDAIVSEAIEPNKRYKLRNSPAKGTTLEGIGPSLRGKRPCRPTREPKPLTGTRDLPHVLREPVIERNIVEKAISSPTLKEPNIERYRAIAAKGEAIIPLEKRSKLLKFTSRTEECKLLAVLGSKTYLVYIPSRRAVLKTSTVKFIEDNTVLSQPTNNTALEGELVDLDLDLEGAVSPDTSNLNTERPISIEIGPSKLEPYESSSNSKLDKPLPDKPINPVIVESIRQERLR